MSFLVIGFMGKCCCVLSRPCLLMACTSSSSLPQRAATFKLFSPTTTAVWSEREREETHQAVTQAVVQLLEGICVGDRASLVEHIGMVG